MKEKDFNFENAIKQLEKIADKLEKCDLTLEESINEFEEGMKLSKECSNFLDSAERKITMLINNGENIEEEDFVPKND